MEKQPGLLINLTAQRNRRRKRTLRFDTVHIAEESVVFLFSESGRTRTVLTSNIVPSVGLSGVSWVSNEANDHHSGNGKQAWISERGDIPSTWTNCTASGEFAAHRCLREEADHANVFRIPSCNVPCGRESPFSFEWNTHSRCFQSTGFDTLY